ncbi:hypothetical protein [Halorubrum sp. N11]|uniref:hypothetical protein n=1 Tax=Halorubrum sp. N11 TaxID=3402276 RepID=UPI003EB7697B
MTIRVRSVAVPKTVPRVSFSTIHRSALTPLAAIVAAMCATTIGPSNTPATTPSAASARDHFRRSAVAAGADAIAPKTVSATTVVPGTVSGDGALPIAGTRRERSGPRG